MKILENKTITPHWIMRLLDKKKAVIAISGNALILKRSNGKTFTIFTESLERENILYLRRIFSKLALPAEHGVQFLQNLSKFD